MSCPKCGFEGGPEALECPRCGVIFSRYRPRMVANSDRGFSEGDNAAETAALSKQEWGKRLLALPAALLFAWLLVLIAPSVVRVLTMWIHEAGHALTAWFCGYWAIPGPWFTPVSSERSGAFSVLLVIFTAFGGFLAWQRQRWFWLTFASVVTTLLLCGRLLLYSDQAQQLIVWGGDAGCFVLGAALMMTFYAGRDTAVYRNGLRWGFLFIGALSFMDAFVVWSGGLQAIPLGENENGLSDPSVLTELYGWSFGNLMDRYHRLAMLCLLALGLVYVLGLIWSDRTSQEPALDYRRMAEPSSVYNRSS